MNFFSIFLLIIVCSISFNCNNKNEQQSAAQINNTTAAVPAIQHKEFVEPSDSLISSEQMNAWLSCNAKLDSLTKSYSDSFKNATPQQRINFQEQFITAQNAICEQGGLEGGYKEYKWILENMGNPKNRHLMDSNGIRSK